jgi:DNA gyrase/topoisomerase IV subunit B
MRPLVEAGKLYRAVTPLYIIKEKSGNKHYCYTEKELEEWKANNTGTYELQHCKGLGELNAETLKEICFENQRFKRIEISDCEKADELLEVLMGKRIEPRKQYVYDNAEELGFNFQ